MRVLKELEFFRSQDFYDDIGQKYGHINERLDVIEKELRALEIIIEKNVDVYYLKTCPSLESYNSETWNKLTQEEYDLLREVLVK